MGRDCSWIAFCMDYHSIQELERIASRVPMVESRRAERWGYHNLGSVSSLQTRAVLVRSMSAFSTVPAFNRQQRSIKIAVDNSSHRKKKHLFLPRSVLYVDNAAFYLMSKEHEQRLRVAGMPKRKEKEVGDWGGRRGSCQIVKGSSTPWFLCMKDSIKFQGNYGIITMTHPVLPGNTIQSD